MPVLLALLLMTLASGCLSMDKKPEEIRDPEPGVALTLATTRANSIRDLKYGLAFTIPSNAAEPLTGRATIRFSTTDASAPIVLDFSPGADHLKSVNIGGKPSKYRVVKDHVVIPKEEVAAGPNTIEIEFRAGDAALNRNPEFLYTLFVPARAHLTFPCFDQPNLKARFSLELNVPGDWNATSNGAETLRETNGDRVRVQYAETQPISTYLFAFAAGKFQIETAERKGRTLRMFHRETDRAKVERNKKAVFDLHASSLEWLEKYTDIPYRFGKFDFVLIPSFQFGGMEHPGTIFYNASSLLLDESATENQMLNRASVIAHETAHMWFGDLVTMQWFNDVWMKEVFANFLAAKIVNPAFPKLNHDLRFLVEHYPAAYSVDRTGGTHPIRQELANLDDAGSLYGAIIYDKAPIVMRQLERVIGEQQLQQGLRGYLKRFEFGNATWSDLIAILDEKTDLNLYQWSEAWVSANGLPLITTVRENPNITFVQSYPPESTRLWTQEAIVALGDAQRTTSVALQLTGERSSLKTPPDFTSPKFVLPTGGGLAYGDFTLDDQSRAYLLAHLPELKDPLMRGAAWVTLYEEMLDRRVSAADFMALVLKTLPSEDTEQNIQLVLGYSWDAFWTFLTDSQRQDVGPQLEQAIRAGLSRTSSASLKATYFNAFRSIVTTQAGISFLERVWRHEETVPGLKLAEPDEASMALDLAVRSVPRSQEILEEQLHRFKNPDRKARFEFVMPALSNQETTRDAWFTSLKDVANRTHEPWVLEGLRYLHHPLRARTSEKYIRPSLEMLTEIQRTGDIFFPTRWMNATLGGHNTPSARDIVRDFTITNQDYPLRLRRIIFQASDMLLRATRN
jgi:aminopeptidase N